MTQDFPELRCIVPKYFDPTTLPYYMKRHHWKYQMFVHIMLLNTMKGNKKGRRKFTAEIPLSYRLLDKFFGSHYVDKIIKSLVAGKVIRRVNNKSIVGMMSKRYAFCEGVMDFGVRPINIEKYTIRRKIGMYRDQHLRDLHKGNEYIRHEFEKLTELIFDQEAATQYINDTYEEGSPEHTSRMINIIEASKMAETSFSDDMYKMDWVFKIDSGGRWHTPVSTMAKDLRAKFLRTPDGEELCEIDQACSHPTFAYLFQLEFAANLRREMQDDGTASIEERHHIFRKPKASIKVDHKWKANIFSGQIYQELIRALKWKGSYDEFKIALFKNVYYNEYRANLTDMEVAFQHYFPNEFEWLRHAKRILGNKGYCKQVTRYESKFWHASVQRIMRNNFRFITYAIIHDSILVPAHMTEEIKQKLEYKITEFFGGLTPTLRIKNNGED